MQWDLFYFFPGQLACARFYLSAFNFIYFFKNRLKAGYYRLTEPLGCLAYLLRELGVAGGWGGEDEEGGERGDVLEQREKGVLYSVANRIPPITDVRHEHHTGHAPTRLTEHLTDTHNSQTSYICDIHICDLYECVCVFIYVEGCVLPERRTPQVSWRWQSRVWAGLDGGQTACPGGVTQQGPGENSVPNRGDPPAAGEAGTTWAGEGLIWKEEKRRRISFSFKCVLTSPIRLSVSSYLSFDTTVKGLSSPYIYFLIWYQ